MSWQIYLGATGWLGVLGFGLGRICVVKITVGLVPTYDRLETRKQFLRCNWEGFFVVT